MAIPGNVLFIGNSLTNEIQKYGTDGLVGILATDAGFTEFDCDREIMSGYSLAQLYTLQAVLDAIDAGGWAAVVLQEISNGPTDPGDPTGFYEAATTFVDRILASSPNARIILFETAAYPPTSSSYPVIYDDMADMQAQLRYHYNYAAETYIPANAAAIPATGIEVARVGDGFEAGYAQTELFFHEGEDNVHANQHGEYLAGLILFSTLFEHSAIGLTTWDEEFSKAGGTPADAQALQVIADSITQDEEEMANALYDYGREGFLDGSLDWDTQDFRVILVDTDDYTANLATDQHLDDVPSAARVATSGALASKTVTDGVADAADVTFTSVSGDQSEALVIYQHTGTESTSRLVAYIDSATGLPVTPNGGDITVTWDNGANKIFKL
jgi:hypothetical protein